MDLLDYYRGRLSLRRLRVLVRRLPADSATVRALDHRAEWGPAEYLLAHVGDRLAELGYMYASTHRAKGRPAPPRPKPLPRPASGGEPATSSPPDAAPASGRGRAPLISGRELAGWLPSGR